MQREQTAAMASRLASIPLKPTTRPASGLKVVPSTSCSRRSPVGVAPGNGNGLSLAYLPVAFCDLISI